jgi:hypothetical protein
MKAARAACLFAWLVAGGISAAAAAPSCPPPSDDEVGDINGFAHMFRTLKRATTLEVLAVGAASAPAEAAASGADTAHRQAGGPPPDASQNGVPWQAARALEAAVPGAHVNVTVIGRHGLTASDLLALMRQELPHKPYRLVLWQTGTVEAVDDLSPEQFYQTLADGAAAVAAAGADLVLIDPQYSRFLAANANMEPYLGALQAAAALPGVGLFHRFGIMRDWVDDGFIDLERAPKGDRQATRLRLHVCLGRELAHELLEAE